MKRNKLFRGIAIACMVLFCVALAGCATSGSTGLLVELPLKSESFIELGFSGLEGVLGH